MIFYDVEVFKYDWLGVFIDVTNKIEHVIVNDRDKLTKLYEDNKKDIWVGFNNKHYDQYIVKGIMLGMNPKEINDHIVVKGEEGWSFSRAFNKLPMINYDLMPNPPVGLKALEGFMGSDIKETEVDFNLDRKLTPDEIDKTIYYCRHDVEETINVFMHKVNDFNAIHGIIQAFPDVVNLRNIGDSEARITAKVLQCDPHDHGDEFDISILPCIQLKKYKQVQEWFLQKAKEAKALNLINDPVKKKVWYKKQGLTITVAGIPHTFGFGGLHGAVDGACYFSPADGAGYHVDVNNYYPSILIAWDLVTRAATNDNYQKVYITRKQLKYKQTHAKDKAEAKMYKKMQLPYKKMLNALSGAMKDKTNPAFDARNNNLMCINGQLMLLDLIEHLEVIPGFKLVQSNTDGLIVWIPDTDEAFDMMDDICWEWECRCSTDKCEIRLETDAMTEIYQKDVNNYLWVEADGSVERKGTYVKELSPLDYDLPIINKALIDRMVYKTPVEETINNCNDLIMFQKVVKLTKQYDHVEHETGDFEIRGTKKHPNWFYKHTDRYDYKCYRVFASSDMHNGRLLKRKLEKLHGEKFGNTPDHCFINNDNIVDVKITPEMQLDRQWYIDLAKRRLKQYGVIN